MPHTRRGLVVQRVTTVLLGGVLLGGCATVAPPSAAAPTGAEAYRPPPPREVSPVATVFNVLLSPIYFAFKVAVCGATVVVGGPATVLAGVTDPYGYGWQRQQLADGFTSNCGPPYTLF